MLEQIEQAARKAACLTRQEYNSEGLDNVLCYDIARLSARDRGYDLCMNIDVDPRPTNVGAAILRMIDDQRALRGEKRQHRLIYRPRYHVN